MTRDAVEVGEHAETAETECLEILPEVAYPCLIEQDAAEPKGTRTYAR